MEILGTRRIRPTPAASLLVFCLAALGALRPIPLAAQDFLGHPLTFADGRVTIGGDISLANSSDDDDPAWFNYTGYEHNALRLFRIGVAADVQLNPHLAILAQLVSENADTPRAHALYLRVRPWTTRAIDFQIGRIPPTFGAFPRRNYAASTDNPVIGYPLAYQYLTSLRADAIPGSADDLLGNRAEGWRPHFPIGSDRPATGVPLVTAFEWDTGVQGRAAWNTVEISAALTTGTLSEPRVRDNNGGKQLAARAAWKPVTGLVAGASFARGLYVADTVERVLPADPDRPDLVQHAWGLDVEYSRDHWLARAETVVSRWRLPAIDAPFIRDSLGAWSISVEGRYAFWPGVFAAGRYDYLGFGALQGSATTLEWDAPVARIEAGGGYYFQRNVVGKVTYQHNWRDAGVRRLGIWAGQLQVWF